MRGAVIIMRDYILKTEFATHRRFGDRVDEQVLTPEAGWPPAGTANNKR